MSAARRPRRCIDAGLPRPALAARRQPADDLGREAVRAATSARRRFERERWATPDGDFIDVDRLRRGPRPPRSTWCCSTAWKAAAPANMPRPSPASRAAAAGPCVPHFRGCSGELNRAPRAYHSGDHEEIGWILRRLREQHGAPLLAAGISLGGNALLRWARRRATAPPPAPPRWRRCARRWTWRPAGAAIDRGFNRLVYSRMFLATMKPKALAKWQQHPGLFDRERAGRGAHALRVRRRLHRAAARFSRYAPTTGRAPRPSRTWRACASRRWCSMRATTPSCRRRRCRARAGRAPGDAVAAGPGRPRRLSARRLSRRRAGHAAGGGSAGAAHGR